jgi:hypothetical protein
LIKVVYGKRGISDDIPSKVTAGFAQCGRISIPERDNFLGLKNDNEVFVVAPE